MTTKHTPGPWTASHYGIRDIGGYICELRWPQRYDGQDDRFKREMEERECDARSIAAVPDLLKAANAAIAYDDAIRSCANDPEKMSSFCSAEGDSLDILYLEWMTASRAAIAKAEGKL